MFGRKDTKFFRNGKEKGKDFDILASIVSNRCS